MPADDSKRNAVDASVSAAWFFEESGSTTAATLLGLGAVSGACSLADGDG